MFICCPARRLPGAARPQSKVICFRCFGFWDQGLFICVSPGPMSGGIPQLTGGRLLRRSVSSAPPLCAPLGFLGIHFFCALGPQRAHSFPLLLLFPPLFGATSEDERVEHLLQRISDLLNKYPDPAANPEQVPATVTQLTRRSRKSCELKSHQRYSQTFRYLLMTFLSPFGAPHWSG